MAFGDRVNSRVTALAATERINQGRLAWFALQRGITFSLINDEPNAVRAYRRAWEDATGAGTDFVRAQAAANLALTHAMRGDTATAREWLGRLSKLDISDWLGHCVIEISAHVAEGLLALDRLDDEEVRSQVQRLGSHASLFEFWPFVAYLHAQHALHTAKATEGLAHLDQVQAINDDSDQVHKGAAQALISRARCDLLLALGRGEKARQLICAEGAARAWSRVPLARIRLLGNQDSDAPHVDPMTWDATTSVRDRLELLLLGAVMSLRHDDSRSAARLFNQALDIYEESGCLRQFAAIQKGELQSLLALVERTMDPHDLAAIARQLPIYPERLVFIELSEHEQAVLEALASTASRQAIADSLFVSVNTVKTQLASIYQKLGTATRAETLVKAREHELLAPIPPEGPATS